MGKNWVKIGNEFPIKRYKMTESTTVSKTDVSIVEKDKNFEFITNLIENVKKNETKIKLKNENNLCYKSRNAATLRLSTLIDSYPSIQKLGFDTNSENLNEPMPSWCVVHRISDWQEGGMGTERRRPYPFRGSNVSTLPIGITPSNDSHHSFQIGDFVMYMNTPAVILEKKQND